MISEIWFPLWGWVLLCHIVILTGGIAPEEANVIISAVIKGAKGPPHKEDVTLLGQSAG